MNTVGLHTFDSNFIITKRKGSITRSSTYSKNSYERMADTEINIAPWKVTSPRSTSAM